MLTTSSSPDCQHEARAYLLNGGATTAFAVRVEIINNENDQKYNIYYCYRREEAEVSWIDNRTIMINGIILDIENDRYDSRSESNDVRSTLPSIEITDSIIQYSPDRHYKAVAFIERWENEITIAYVTIEDQKTERIWDIYYSEDCNSIQMKWLDNQTIVINGVEVNIETEMYKSTES